MNMWKGMTVAAHCTCVSMGQVLRQRVIPCHRVGQSSMREDVVMADENQELKSGDGAFLPEEKGAAPPLLPRRLMKADAPTWRIGSMKTPKVDVQRSAKRLINTRNATRTASVGTLSRFNLTTLMGT